MRKLIEQLMKFGIVGVVAFIIDWGLMNILLMTHMHNVLATSISFFVSLIFNYLASINSYSSIVMTWRAGWRSRFSSWRRLSAGS